LFLAHCAYPMRRDHWGRVSRSTTARALRHAAACGTGSGGSCGAKGGVSGTLTIGVNSLRMAKSCREVGRNAIGAERRYL
jgi:hypothetical protein